MMETKEYFEKVMQERTPEQRFRFRLEYSQPIVLRMMNELEKIRLAGTEYGEMVHRAVTGYTVVVTLPYRI